MALVYKMTLVQKMTVVEETNRPLFSASHQALVQLAAH
jgi:hypothetical protein